MLVGFVIAGLLIHISMCQAAEPVWVQRADMPTPRWMHTSAVVNGKIYVIGGASSETDFRIFSTVEEYDPATDTWTRKADMPTPRGWIPPSSPVVNGKIYVIGGGDDRIWDLPTVEEYDPATDTWTQKAEMPTPRWCLATCAVNGKIYTIGGVPNSYTGLAVVEEYDPVTDTWTRKADKPTGVWGLCADVVNGKIYAFGGRRDVNAGRIVEEYDPATDTWMTKGNMLIDTSNMASVVLYDKIFVIGGWIHSNSLPYKSVLEYDPIIDRWTETTAGFPVPRSNLTACVLNNKIYAIGGTDRRHPCPATSTVYEFDPPPPLMNLVLRRIDFNGDGIVDSADMCIMVNHWGEDYPLCDIGPMPWGDGIVDVQGLIVLAEHLFEEILPDELIAYWTLDETEGDVTYNSTGYNHGILSGNPTLQPNSGQVAGALEFDGIDDYISTDFVLDPSLGAFSVLVWVKGGAPRQVIISQSDGTDTGTGNTWLGLDALGGNLMTGLVPPSVGWVAKKPLVSESIITDGQWHHIGFVWDGSYRILYVDGIEVAKDTAAQAPLKSATGGLHIGAGKTLAAGTFFSGLIDDVRIYNRVVSP